MRSIPKSFDRRGVARAQVAMALALVVSSASAAEAAAPASSAESSGNGPVIAAVTEQPRSFGYLVGDLLSQRVLLEAHDRPFVPSALPPPARLGAWFERRGAHVETTSDGRRWLVVDYQVINAPTAVATVRLASWELAGPGLALRIPAWDVTIAPV
ncbi:MAG TPA: hypothetical protein VH328_01310, partial [Burkholderiaceae bacterium]|nr:hypothetical protein [Burkholderiaceae bacterium]